MNSDGVPRPNKVNLFAADAPPASISFRKSQELVWVNCSTPGCTNRIKVKAHRVKLKRLPKCPACQRRIALASAAQNVVAAECAARNKAARERRLKVLAKV